MHVASGFIGVVLAICVSIFLLFFDLQRYKELFDWPKIFFCLSHVSIGRHRQMTPVSP